jgi:hypothetical protein
VGVYSVSTAKIRRIEQHGCLTLSDRGIPTLNIKETGIDKGEWVVVA